MSGLERSAVSIFVKEITNMILILYSFSIRQLCVSEQHCSVLFPNESSFWMNHLKCTDPFIKTCFIPDSWMNLLSWTNHVKSNNECLLRPGIAASYWWLWQFYNYQETNSPKYWGIVFVNIAHPYFKLIPFFFQWNQTNYCRKPQCTSYAWLKTFECSLRM